MATGISKRLRKSRPRKTGQRFRASLADYDRHGRGDIFVANDSVPNLPAITEVIERLRTVASVSGGTRKRRLTGILYEFNFDTMCEVHWN
jgi:hypothetical protein